MPGIARIAARNQDRPCARSVSKEKRADVAEQALLTCAHRKYTHVKIERAESTEDIRSRVPGDAEADAARRYVEQRAACGVERIARGVEIDSLRARAAHQQPRSRPQPERGRAFRAGDGRVRRMRKRYAEGALRLVGER